jgi:hypothetical protein
MIRFPQHQECAVPTPVRLAIRRRLLGRQSVDELTAEKACEHWGGNGADDCVFDVLTTGDLEMAVTGCLLSQGKRGLREVEQLFDALSPPGRKQLA